MNDDDRLTRYLTDRAEGLTLAPGNADAVMRRASRRRLRRRGVVLTAAIAAGVAGTTAVLNRGGGQPLHTAGNVTPVTPSTYHWSTVKPGHGLGYGRATTELADGSVYSLSTAPGPYDPNKQDQGTSLYRTTDGAEWSQVAGPSGLSPSDLASAGGELYAVGTAPAGGSAKSISVASRAASGDWSSAPLPSDLVALQQRHPGQIALGNLELAAKDASHLVVSVTAVANLDPQQLRPELKDQNVMTTWTDTGLDVRQLPDCTAPANLPNTRPAAAVKASGVACKADAQAAASGPVSAHYSYDQLGIDPELRTLVNGRTFAYASDDGHTFQPVTLPVADHAYVAGLVALADGYHLVETDQAQTGTSTVLSSADGHTWAADGTLSGSAQSVGQLGGRLAVSTLSTNGDSTAVEIRQPDGSWHDLPLVGDVPTPAGGSAYIGEVAFGPLGMAATAGSFKDKQGGVSGTYLLHSTDGSSISVEDIGAAVGSPKQPVGVIVTADAIAVRLSDPSPDAGQPGHVPTQTVLVGTPAG